MKKIMIDLQAEWNRCMQMAGHEPREDQWYTWTLELMRGEREPQKTKAIGDKHGSN